MEELKCSIKLPKGFWDAKATCANERPARKVFCQLAKGHKGSHRAIIFWEDEE
jgi:hypothetical protein